MRACPGAIGQSFDWFVPAETEVLGARVADRPTAFPLAELARRICHLAMEGERDPARLHDRALAELIPATIWRELS